ncbi:MAG: hypothetical protein ACQEXC_05115 [Pseudomonadota bacterium]
MRSPAALTTATSVLPALAQDSQRLDNIVVTVAGFEQAMAARIKASLGFERALLVAALAPVHAHHQLVVQFMDERHVRVFGEGGLYQAVMDRLGLENAWRGETNAWASRWWASSS